MFRQFKDREKGPATADRRPQTIRCDLITPGLIEVGFSG